MQHSTPKYGAQLRSLALLQGCVLVHDDGPDRNHREGTTIGEELQDLNEAYEDGLLTRQEYDRIRERILNR